MRNKLSKLAMAVGLAAVSSLAMAQQTASLFGKLTDQNNQRVFAGAKVEIEELNRTSLSRTDGTFRFPNLPEGEYVVKRPLLINSATHVILYR
jgi:hypothetical protein